MLGELPILIPFAFALREEDTGTDAVSRKFSLQVEGIPCSRKRVKTICYMYAPCHEQMFVMTFRNRISR